MIRLVIIYCLCFFSFIRSLLAIESNHIDFLLETIETQYFNNINYNVLSNNLYKEINNFDNNLRIYSSGTKAYLYKKQTLLKSFDLPKDNSSHKLWKNLIFELIATTANNSETIRNNYNVFEKNILNSLANNLDKYSRLEQNNLHNQKISYEKNDDILIIKAYSFYKGISDDIKNLILQNKNCKGLVLDLRNNRGGDFNEATLTSGLFLDDALITYTVEKDETKRYYTSTKGDILNGKNIVILVNKYTASASEIVVASLVEQSRATVVGTSTYGKGTIMAVENIGNRLLFISSGVFYTPSGKKIENTGITPQICTGISESCNIADKNMNKDIFVAINLIKNKIG